MAPLLVIAALSGFLYAFAPSLENFVYRDAITASSTEPAQPLEEQIEAAQAVHPDLQLAAVESFEDPAKTTRVLFDDPALESSSYRQAVFVDPGSLEITGDLVQYGSSRALPLRTWISEGHRQLWLGDPGAYLLRGGCLLAGHPCARRRVAVVGETKEEAQSA